MMIKKNHACRRLYHTLYGVELQRFEGSLSFSPKIGLGLVFSVLIKINMHDYRTIGFAKELIHEAE